MTLLQAPPAVVPPSLREQKKARTRAALHAAAAQLVAAADLSSVTVDEICAEAQVSPRTFFNYYPSKGAAVLGLPEPGLRQADVDAFLAGRRNIVRDLCDLVASALDGPGRLEKAALHDLLQRHPELQPELHAWLIGLRRGVIELVEQRSDAERARSALALVLAAVASVPPAAVSDEPLGERLWASVRSMVAAATAP